ncbi:hypothetical protein DFH08DRAFT_816740 [Mycena albidolilacea]|uniref:Uncharacterized protein n=1 Tax=Mycena albidolilacea TaxID=1033008 RepID=A0AAD6ZL50_9AGAR|nr:hypothetical protein DFH08DRAFT_816740 [Mycena albidolilacea]
MYKYRLFLKESWRKGGRIGKIAPPKRRKFWTSLQSCKEVRRELEEWTTVLTVLAKGIDGSEDDSDIPGDKNIASEFKFEDLKVRTAIQIFRTKVMPTNLGGVRLPQVSKSQRTERADVRRRIVSEWVGSLVSSNYPRVDSGNGDKVGGCRTWTARWRFGAKSMSERAKPWFTSFMRKQHSGELETYGVAIDTMGVQERRGKKITEFGRVVPKQPCDLSMQPRALEFGIRTSPRSPTISTATSKV